MNPNRDPLLQPFAIGQLELRNRIVSTSHEPAYSVEGLPLERYRLYHEAKARGGIGLTMIGGSALVAPDSPAAFGNLHLYDDRVIAPLRELAAGVHRHGAAVMCQITHLGRRTSNYDGDWLPVLAPSAVREPAHRAFPKAMEDWDMERVIAAYATAARRCRDGGMDGIEVEAYGHLLDAFWSPRTNRREDEYGGSLENRMRFGLAVLAGIRESVGSDFVVGIRLVVDEATDQGLDATTGLAIAARLAESGLVDFFSVIRGHIDTDNGLASVIPGMGTPAGPHLDAAADVRRATGLPVMHAARINDVATARHAVAEGLVDLVGMTRAHLADPDIVRRIRAGEEHRIRPCVGAGYCIDRIYEGREALCLHNAATGRETHMPHQIEPAAAPRRIVVVGAGPAGLEAARVCAERGHEVVLFEAADQPGGQLRLAARVPRRREIIGIVDWLYAEVERLGVQPRFNHYAEAADILGETPDVVLVATGGLPDTGFLHQGESLVHTSWDLLSGDVAPGRQVLIFDDNGQHPGMSCAEWLAEQGCELELVTPERSIAPDIGGTNYPAYLRCFHRHGVRLSLNLRLRAVRRENDRLVAELVNEYSGEREYRHVDQVVTEHGTLPLDELYFELKPQSVNGGAVDVEALLAGRPQSLQRNPAGRFQLFRIGDAVNSRNVHAAIHDALRLCKDL